jgi:putative ABC transport system permease protein
MFQHHIRSALRGFARNRLVTAVQISSLWLGLLGFLAAYAVAEDFLSAGARYPGADRSYVLTMTVRADGMAMNNVPLAGAPATRYLREELPQLEAIARVSTSMIEHVVAAGDRRAYQEVLFADPDYFVLFPEPLQAATAGNPLDAPMSAILAPTAAAALFGDADPVGRNFRLAGTIDVNVAGVFAEAPVSHFGENYDLLVSFDTMLALQRAETGTDSEQPGQMENWFPMNLSTFLRLPADGSLSESELREHLAGFAERRISPDMLADVRMSFGLLPLAGLVNAAFDLLLGGGIGVPITALIMIIGFLILAMSSLNYASLAAAQSYARAKHVGLLKVLGARRANVFMQAIVEAALLVLCSLLLALATAEFVIRFATTALGLTLDLPYLCSLSLWLVLGGLIGGVGLIAGGYPALLLARVKPVSAMRAAGQSGRQRIRRVLVGLQFTAASLLLVLVLVMLNHQQQLEATGGTASGSPIVVVSSKLPDAENVREPFRDALASHPGVQSVSATGQAPWDFNQLDVATLSRDPGSEGQGFNFLLHDIDYDYFETMDGHLLAGRLFSRDRAEDQFFWGQTRCRRP